MFLMLVVPHELGHFTAAKAFGVRVNEFAIGLGNKVFGFTRGGTRYALRSLAIAGYVQRAGMAAGEYAEPAGFDRAPALQWSVILLAGRLPTLVLPVLIPFSVLPAQADPRRG